MEAHPRQRHFLRSSYSIFNSVTKIIKNDKVLGYFKYVDDVSIIYDRLTIDMNVVFNELNKTVAIYSRIRK